MGFLSRVGMIKAVVFGLAAALAAVLDLMDGDGFTQLADHIGPAGLGLSLEALQAGVQRYVDPDLWDSILVPILTTPTVVVCGVVAAAAFVFAKLLAPRRA